MKNSRKKKILFHLKNFVHATDKGNGARFTQSFLCFFPFFFSLSAVQWNNNNNNSRFVPPRNLLAYSSVCVPTYHANSYIFSSSFLPSLHTSLSPVYVPHTCLRASMNLHTLPLLISRRASTCVHLRTLIDQQLHIFFSFLFFSDCVIALRTERVCFSRWFTWSRHCTRSIRDFDSLHALCNARMPWFIVTFSSSSSGNCVTE